MRPTLALAIRASGWRRAADKYMYDPSHEVYNKGWQKYYNSITPFGQRSATMINLFGPFAFYYLIYKPFLKKDKSKAKKK